MTARVERRVRAATAMVVVAALFTVHLDGCAARGAVVRGISEPVGDRAAADHFQLARVVRGNRMTLILRDGSALVGRYQGVRRSDDSLYAARVAEFRAARTDTVPIPAPGSMLRVYRGSGRARLARLEGYGFRSLELSWNGRGEPQEVPFEGFTAASDSSGHLWTADALTAEAVTGRLPMMSEIVLATDAGERAVPVDRIQQVEFRTSSGQVVIATLAAVSFAAVMVVALVNAAKPPSGGCTGPTEFPPLLPP